MRDIFYPRLADAISTAREGGDLSRLSMFDLSDALEVFELRNYGDSALNYCTNYGDVVDDALLSCFGLPELSE